MLWVERPQAVPAGLRRAICEDKNTKVKHQHERWHGFPRVNSLTWACAGYRHKWRPHISAICVCACVCDLLCVLEGWDDADGGVNSSSVGRGDNGRQSASSCVFVAVRVSCKVSASLFRRSSSTFINLHQPRQKLVFTSPSGYFLWVKLTLMDVHLQYILWMLV